jgi:hypothetical protein
MKARGVRRLREGFPSPLAGEGQGGGSDHALQSSFQKEMAETSARSPTPSRPHKGGGGVGAPAEHGP